MTSSAIGGKALDASALVALVRGRLSALTWVDIARTTGIVLVVPSLAFAEVRAVRPDSGPDLADLLSHPSVVVAEADALTAKAVMTMLDRAGVFDPLAGQVVYESRRRGWPALTDDPERLRRVDPDVETERV